ncbi:endonuclease/exonuclease/phosphatase family protein [Thiorhodovibrio frisius]|uniref:Exonuclease III n=1 Tax=Thiorhodovibrio frisius TaxID=631362 RepID=H8YYV9_9GAMM|nr:endonuclease/exonuclease/phosphatase family protein [Thiorhodovibrio frisius]EIC23635.1 exonuclease III [Thiorhodovibrio frisius]WPL23273.1 exodeoxyribonuclease III [Thiorhodovibrio frisius]
MKIVTLNIQHGGGKRIPGILNYLQSQDADAIVLTEFRENSNAEALRFGLAADGYRYFAGASIAPKENTVCIFSRQPFVARTYPALPAQDRHRLISAHFDGISVYGVYFSQNKAKVGLFDFLAKGCHLPTEAAYFIVGDFNTGLHFQDEEGATFFCTTEFKALSESGVVDSWRNRNPATREFSWYSNHGNGFRIDHVFSSTEGDALIERVYYDHKPREAKATDHAALVVEYVS